jgi:zinc protease
MPRTVIIDVPGSEQAWIRLQVRSDPRSDARYYSLLVGNAELGGGTSSRLFQEVRIKNSLAYIVGSGLDARKDANILLALAGPKSENVAKVLRIFFDELDRLSSQQLNQELLVRRKAAAASTFSRQAETGAGYAAALANLIEEGLPLQRANQEANMVETVTSQSVLSAARRSLRPHAASIVIIGDASKFLDDVRTLRPEVEVIKFDELNLASIRDVRKPR